MANRIFGLSGSGIDVDQLVKDMMAVRRASYDKLWKKKTQLEYLKADYNAMHNTLKGFRESTVWNYTLEGNLTAKSVSSSNESAVTATANANALNVSHTIEVIQLAEGAHLASLDKISIGEKADLITQFNLENSAIYKDENEQFKTFNIVLKNGEDKKVTIEVNLAENATINDIVRQINESDIGIKANYDATVDRFFLYTIGTGQDVKIDFSDTVDDAALHFIKYKLKLFPEEESKLSAEGKNAVFNLDGAENLEQSKNTFNIGGVTYNLKATTGEGNSVRLEVAPDNEKSIQLVKDFVEQYNTILAKINGELNETRYRDYEPLTDQEKQELTEHELKKWEELAQSGMLRNDTLLQGLVFELRRIVSTPVEGISGKYNSLAALGINTGDYTEGGKLHINETKLRDALKADPDIVRKIFTSRTDEDKVQNLMSEEKITEEQATFKLQGVAVRMYEALRVGLEKVKTRAGTSDSIDSDTQSTLAKEIKRYNDDLANLERRLKMIEDRYYKQFTRMELALSNLYQQSNWLYQQFTM